ncbi:MAG: Cof-type HAD-IIB family hydrolase [Cyanobacteriota bacterium]|nr:Cof-type HAD-IIB family hydrolase [Cyanobacteriota bacterium]
MSLSPYSQAALEPQRGSRPDIRLVMVDIDGTITGAANTVSPRVRQALRQAKQQGVYVGIATGRMYRSALRFHHEIAANMPICAYQGAMIKDPATDKMYKHWSLNLEVAQQLLAALDTYPLIAHIYVDDQLYVRDWNPLSLGYAERSQVPIHLLSDLGSELTLEPTKVLAMTEDTDLILELLGSLRQQFPADLMYLTRSVPTFLEATHPQVNKGNAVKYLAEEVLGLRPEQVMTIGDSDNDVEMLAYAGLGVAMGNASAEVQAYADWVAPSVDEDGVAVALETFVLKEK